MKRALTLLAAAMLWSSLPSSSAAAAAEAAQQDGPAVTLVVTVDLGEDDHEIRKVVRAAVDAALVSAGIAVEEDAEAVLVVEIRWSEGSKTDFAVTLRLGRDASAIPSPIHSFGCGGCSAPQLLERIEEEVKTAVPPALSEPEVEEAEPQEAPSAGPADEAAPPPPKGNPRVLRTAGLATLLTGASLTTGTAIAMTVWAVSDRPILAYEWSMLGVGSAAAITGGVMLGVAMSRERKQRARLSVLPTPSGIVLSGRF